MQVVAIASAVATEAMRFRVLIRCCEEDPLQREEVDDELLIPWRNIPSACGFKVYRPQDDGVQRRATQADKLAQQRRYAKACAWASQCGLSEAELRAKLKQVPAGRNQRGRSGLPAALLLYDLYCTAWEHARRLCVV